MQNLHNGYVPRKTAYKSSRLSKKRVQGFSWKKSRKIKKSYTQFKTALASFVLVLLSIAFLGGWGLYSSITATFASASSSSSNITINDDISTVLIITADSINSDIVSIIDLDLVFYDRRDSSITTFKIPETTIIDVPGKFGEEPLSKVLALGASINNDSIVEGVSSVTMSIQKLFGYEVDKYILTTSETHSLVTATLIEGDLVNSVSLLKRLVVEDVETSGIITNMESTEINAYRKFATSVTRDNLNSIILDYSDLDAIDKEIFSIAFNSPVAEERKSIAVLNGTTVSGLAGAGTRVIKNLGGRVVSTGNTKTAYETSILIVDSKDSATFQELRNFYKIETILTKEEATLIKENEISRADITLILGFDIARSL